MLDNEADFRAIFPKIAQRTTNLGHFRIDGVGELYCATCGGIRRMDAVPMYYAPTRLVLTLLSCVQCDASFVGVWHSKGFGQNRLAILPEFDRGGITSPNTPDGVGYYLGQAALAQAVGAFSAAVAMYRAAVEQILLVEGFTQPMLGAKIKALEEATKSGKAPAWASEIDTDYLAVLKDLGNASIHAGDISVQKEFDAELLAKMSATVRGLLFFIYEAPHEKRKHLDSLRAAVALVKKK